MLLVPRLRLVHRVSARLPGVRASASAPHTAFSRPGSASAGLPAADTAAEAAPGRDPSQEAQAQAAAAPPAATAPKQTHRGRRARGRDNDAARGPRRHTDRWLERLTQLAERGEASQAVAMLKQRPRRTLRYTNIALRACSRSTEPWLAREVYAAAGPTPPSVFTLSLLLHSLSRVAQLQPETAADVLTEGRRAVADALARHAPSLEPDQALATALLKLSVSTGASDLAWREFARYREHREIGGGDGLLPVHRIAGRVPKIDIITHTLMLNDAARLHKPQLALTLYNEMLQHAHSGLDARAFHAVLRAFSRHRLWADECRTIVSRDMPKAGVAPDATTCALVLRACRFSDTVDVAAAEALRRSIQGADRSPDVATEMMGVYARATALARSHQATQNELVLRARALWAEFPGTAGRTAWTHYLRVLCHAHRIRSAIDTLQDMPQADLHAAEILLRLLDRTGRHAEACDVRTRFGIATADAADAQGEQCDTSL